MTKIKKKTHIYICNVCESKLTLTGATLVSMECKQCKRGFMEENKS